MKENSNYTISSNQNSSQECSHELRIDTLCAMCGKEVGHDNKQLLPAVHSSDKLLQTVDSAKILQRKINKSLNLERKMILILDIDQTILHTTYEKFTGNRFLCKTQAQFKLFPRGGSEAI